MAGYFEEFGAGEQRRERAIRWIVISALVLVIGVISGYFVLRTYPARQSASRFIKALSNNDYRAAYRMWGCDKPCRDYSFEKFMEDWGPKSEFARASATAIEKTRYCNTGIIVTLRSPAGSDVALWYERKDKTLGFSPWPVCVERIPAPPVPGQAVPAPY